MISVTDLLPWCHVPPLPSRWDAPAPDGEPDLVRESEQAAAQANAARFAAFGPHHDSPRLSGFHGSPAGPEGLDPVVFGTVRRARADDADYGL